MAGSGGLIQVGLPGLRLRKPRVTLVRGPIVFGDGALNNEATPAIAFAYISAYLERHGYSPVMVDAIGEGLNRTWPLPKYPGFNGHGLPFNEILDRIPLDSEIIAFSAMFSGEWPVLRDLIMEIRGKFPDALLVAGGEHITALTEYSLRDCPALDLCVRGEGEHAFFEVLEAYAETGGFGHVNGIGFLDAQGAYRENDAQPRIRKVDEIPWPSWPDGYLEKFWEAGKSYGVGTARDMPFMISRGCPYRCTFCSSEQMWTTRYVLRDIEDVVAELKAHIRRYDITGVQLYDLTAITKKKWLVDFCQRLLAEGIRLTWSLPSGTRSEALDRESLSVLRQIGCEYLVFAPESGSERTLELIKKRIHLGRLTESVLEARRQGFKIRTNLIIGFPEETLADVCKTLWYGIRMAARGVDEPSINIFSPYPGTEIYRDLVQQGKIALNDEYFFSLTSLNSAFFTARGVSLNDRIGATALKMLRLFFILMNYALSYLLYPHRIARTIRNLFRRGSASSTVFEHRLKDFLRRNRATV